MSASPFPLKSTLGRTYRVDLSDTRRTKQALHRLGYFKTPSYGLTDYPDEPLFAAIEDFQRDNDLSRDGIMRPDGETATRLGQILSEAERRPFMTTPGINPDAEPYPPRGYAARLLTSPRAFAISAEIGPDRDNDPRDVLAARRGLAWAGFLSPAASERPAPDATLFEAIERFQEANDLEVDGWMQPGGPTARTLDERIADKVAAWREAHPGEAEASDEGVGDVQTAWLAPALRAGTIMAPLVIGPIGDILSRQGKRLWPGETWDAGTPESGNPRTSVGEGNLPGDREEFPANPPSGEEFGGRTEFPSTPPEGDESGKEEMLPVAPEIPTLGGRPINEILKNDPAIFEAISDELQREFQKPLEAHRGNDVTQWGNMRTAQLCKEEFTAWGPDVVFEHVGGAYRLTEAGVKEDLKETYKQNVVTNGTKGSSHLDLTYLMRLSPEGEKRTAHMNTGHTRKDGELVAHEQRQLANAIQNSTNEIVGSAPKLRADELADSEKLAQWEERVRVKCREMLTKVFGPPS